MVPIGWIPTLLIIVVGLVWIAMTKVGRALADEIGEEIRRALGRW